MLIYCQDARGVDQPQTTGPVLETTRRDDDLRRVPTSTPAGVPLGPAVDHHLVHLPRRQERMLCHVSRRDLPPGSVGRHAIHCRGEEQDQAKLGGIQAHHRFQEQTRFRGLLQVDHGLSQPEAQEHREGRQGIPLGHPRSGSEEDHWEIRE